jgi:hypothetical protein
MSEQTEEYITIWATPTIVKPEFRLYYDDKGNVICYTCDKLEGDYIVVDAQTFAAGRPDLRVINGKISSVASNLIISKLEKHDKEGQTTSVEDISIIPDSKSRVKKQKWKLTTNEYG